MNKLQEVLFDIIDAGERNSESIIELAEAIKVLNKVIVKLCKRVDRLESDK